MTTALVKALAALAPIVFLLAGAVLLTMRQRSLPVLLQLVGVLGLVVVGLSHLFEALLLLPVMGFGLQASFGHYVDLAGAIVGTTFFPAGYFLYARQVR